MKLGNAWKMACVCGFAAAGMAVVAIAGPLTPPAGPVASTYKTLTEVEPRIAVQSLSGGSGFMYIIAQPGSYYLTGNITGPGSGIRGIAVAAPNVTIDLNGFTMDGGGVGDDAIYALSGSSDGLTVRNGTISNWVKEGVDGFFAAGCRLQSLQVRNSVAGYGVVTGPGSIISDCSVLGSAVGIVTTEDSTVQDCVAKGNVSGGIWLGSGSTATRCIASGSTTSPANGFQAGNGCTLVDCTARANNGYGIDAGNDCTITGCTAVSNMNGIRVAAGGTIDACTAARNTSAHGIIALNGGTTIRGCTATGNAGDGIRAGSGCLVLANTCTANGPVLPAGGSGIFTTGNGARVEGNITTGNYYGVALNGTNNFMVRNLSTGNTGGPNQIIAGNKPAQIINNPASLFVSTDPWSNVQY